MSKTSVVVLGCGRVGSAIVRDLDADDDFRVTAVDASTASLDRLQDTDAERVSANLSEPDEIFRVIGDADLVVGAVPGAMGHATLRAVIEAGRNVVDISFFPEDPFTLDTLARERDVVALVDCGLAPGLSNLLLGRMEAELDRVDRFRCLVGGLPLERRLPFQYKAPFSPADVIEEYTRPARLREGGTDVERPALSEVELVDLPGMGTLEAFNTDGLRTVLRTSDVPWMVEKTMRYPGHADLMRAFRETGLFDTEPLEMDGRAVAPRELTSHLLFEHWRFDEGEPDVSVMRVEVDGELDGQATHRVFDLLDHYDAATGISSMARTTGYTCTAGVRLVAKGLYSEPGITPPEILGRDADNFAFLMDRLAERDIVFRQRS
ncbi:MAG: saccharopine dehydrogenase C-terminal domain-containing protein [Gemmatimonadota bacterium]|jgi:lysine 6-dehydrogenase